MLGRSRRRLTVSHLSLLIAAVSCYRPSERSTSALPAGSTTTQLLTSGDEVVNQDALRSALTLATTSGSTVVDARTDSAAVRAIRAFLNHRTSELDVEFEGGASYVRLRPDSRFGDYRRLFVVDGVPVADGFRLTIRTSALERIEVIDDSLSKSPYGPRAARGVVLISTLRTR